MKKNKHIYDEDIDLLELLFILWRGKFIIIFFALVTGIFSSIFFWIKDNSQNTPNLYETKLNFIISPKFLYPKNFNDYFNFTSELYIDDFKDLYFSKDIFNKWSDTNKQETLLFEEIIDFKLSNELYLKKESENFTSFKNNTKDQKYYLYINTDRLNILNDIDNYFDFVSENLNSKYLLLFKKKRDHLTNFFNEFNNSYPESTYSEYIYQILILDNVINLLLNDHNIIKKEYFEKILNLNKSTKSFSFFKLAILILISSIISSTYLIIKNKIQIKNNP